MRVLLLLAIPLLFQDPAPAEPLFSRPFKLRNANDEPLATGAQVAVQRPDRVSGKVEVHHKGKRVPCWSTEESIWFRTAAPIAPYESDEGYEVRYGKVEDPETPHEVFDFFEQPGDKAPDPKRWEFDPFLKFEADHWGWAVTHIPERRNELDPASLIARHAKLPADFIIDAELRWEIAEKAAFTFAMRLEFDETAKVDDVLRKRCAELIAKFKEEDIEVQDLAMRDLLDIGSRAVPQLVEAMRSPEAQVRARAAAAIDAIHKKSPPQLARVGVRAEAGQKPKVLFNQGKGTVEFAALERTGKASFSIERLKDGRVSVRGEGQQWRKIPSQIPGTVGRLRFDFWGDPAGYIGAVWINRVIIRRNLELQPEATWGDAKEVR